MRALVAVLCLVSLVPSGQAAWQSSHSDERNSGYVTDSTYEAYQDIWWSLKVKPATQIEATPVVKDGVVVVAAWDHGLRAYDAESGTTKWNITTPTGNKATTVAKYVGTPVISGGRVFAVDAAGKLEARDLQKGTLLGTATVGPTLASPAIHEGKIFIGNEAGAMQAFDTETLTLLWKFTISDVSEGTKTTTSGTSTSTVCDTKFSATGSQIRGAPAIYGGNVIFGSLNHWVFAINEQGDTAQKTWVNWMFKTDDAVFSSPTVYEDEDDEGWALVGSYDEHLYKLPAAPSSQGPEDLSDKPCTAYKNEAEWEFEVPSTIGSSKVHSTPATDGQRVYFGANNGRVYAINLDDGEQTWEFKTNGPVISSPAVANGIVVVGSDDTNVYWLNAVNGSKIKSYQTDSAIKSNPAIDGKRAFVTSFDGTTYMFGPKVPARPDLLVSEVTYDDGIVSIKVRNAGAADSTATKLRVILDGTALPDTDLPIVKAGQTEVVNIERKLEAGSHTIVVTADQGNLVQESSEANNGKTVGLEGKKSDGSGKGFGIPGVSPALVLLAISLLALARRRR